MSESSRKHYQGQSPDIQMGKNDIGLTLDLAMSLCVLRFQTLFTHISPWSDNIQLPGHVIILAHSGNEE